MHNGYHTHCNRALRHLIDICKKAGIRLYRAFVQVYNMGAFDEIFVRFVKADMTVKSLPFRTTL